MQMKFKKMKFKNIYMCNKIRLFLAILAILISSYAMAGPAKNGPVYCEQPDGTSFSAIIRGDEFFKIITTEAGCAITQDSDGWWCYAYYDDDGAKRCSGWKVGSNAPADVISESRNIPLQKLAVLAKQQRSFLPAEEKPILKRIFEQRGVDTRSSDSEPVVKHGLIILAQYKDIKMKYGRDDFNKMLNQDGYNRFGATGSANEYFKDQFGDRIDFKFDVSDVVTLENDREYYGGNSDSGGDKNAAQMVIEACNALDSKLDFSIYDDDGDGKVDNVFVFFAGKDEADGGGEDCIWSHAWDIYSGTGQTLVLDGKQISRYACTAELDGSNNIASIGAFCHEYFHIFGTVDLYDTDYEMSGGIAAGTWGRTSLMDCGNSNNGGNTPPYINAIEREHLGIAEAIVIDADGHYTLEPVHKNNMFYRINTDHEDEYYLLECRSNEKWDAYVGGSGLLVYHIDRSSRNAGFSEKYNENHSAELRWNFFNEVNCRPDHQCADLMEADSRPESFSVLNSYWSATQNIKNIFFPTDRVNSISPSGKPYFSTWSGYVPSVSVTNISRTEEGVSFNVQGFSETTIVPPVVSSYTTDRFMDAAIIQFEADKSFEGEAVIEWGLTGKKTEKITKLPYSPGKYSVTLSGLEPNSKTYSVKIYFVEEGIVGEATTISFMTQTAPKEDWPYIYMGSIKKNTDGSVPAGSKFPLRVYNATAATKIKWTFNGKEIEAGGDGYYVFNENGVLRVYISLNNSNSIIEKKIIVK